jgi:CRISPR/Cas system-associated protein endoribonuclease Cas2|tara:strand:+ start:2780 stop:3094 length:315 start_codon:yes stop_codon:yes gene_type:complete
MPESENRISVEMEELQQRVAGLEHTVSDLLEFTSILMHNLKSNEMVSNVRVVKDSEGNISDLVIKEKQLDLTDALTAIEIMMVRKGTYQQLGKKARIGGWGIRT